MRRLLASLVISEADSLLIVGSACACFSWVMGVKRVRVLRAPPASPSVHFRTLLYHFRTLGEWMDFGRK